MPELINLLPKILLGLMILLTLILLPLLNDDRSRRSEYEHHGEDGSRREPQQ